MRAPFRYHNTLGLLISLITVGLISTPAIAKPPLNVTVSKPGQHAELEDRHLYELTLKCQATAPLPSGNSFNSQIQDAIVHFNQTASHYLIITTNNTLPPLDTQNPGKLTIPSSANPISVPGSGGVTVFPIFSVNYYSSGVDYRTTCSGTTYISGSQKVYLVPQVSWTRKASPGPVLQAVYTLAQLVSPIWSIFAPLPAAVASKVTNVGQTQGTVTNALNELNREENYAGAVDIGTGTYIVTTAYSKITVTIKEVASLVKAKSPRILKEFRDQLNLAQTNNDWRITSVDCAIIENKLRDIGFSLEEDIPYAIAYLATRSFNTEREVVQCLGKDYALNAARLGSILWDWVSPSYRVTAEDANNEFPPSDTPDMALQPEYSNIVAKLSDFVLALTRISRNSEPIPDQLLLDLGKNMKPTVLLNDKTVEWSFQSIKTPVDGKGLVSALLSRGYYKFGCNGPMKATYGDNPGQVSALFVAFKVNKDAKTASVGDALLIGPLFASGLISTMYLSTTPNMITNVLGDPGNNWNCNGLTIEHTTQPSH